ncbi:MAG TPA: potassium channel family protein [Isosphaeraceae bacterium]|nr:potassium channel family protein [Isosphaeraceae bacterium]
MTTISPTHEKGSRRARLRSSMAFDGRYGRLLVALIAVIALAPLVVQGWAWKLVLAVLASAILVTGLYAVRPTRPMLHLGLLLASVDISIGQASSWFSVEWLRVLQTILWLLTLLFVTGWILESILAGSGATIETLQAATCVYLLLGLIWMFVFSLIELAGAGEFQYPRGPSSDLYQDDSSQRAEFLRLLYFSYATLTTVGYGDITPSGGVARIFAVLEAIAGQLYIAIMIARLVGMHIGQGPGSQKR